MDYKKKGLYERYKVERIDGKKDGTKYGIGYDTTYGPANYFVLRMGPKKPNKHTNAALKAYAESCKDDIPELSRDLFRYLVNNPT